MSVDGRFTCPNVDGTRATGGCVFCDNRSFSPSRRLAGRASGPGPPSIRRQLDEGIRRVTARYGCEQFVAYFQPATNTYAPVDRLERLYREALDHPQVVGLAIGTRPDCVGPEVVELLGRLARETHVSLEVGMQTMHDRTLAWMNRAHTHAEFVACVERCRDRGFRIGTHVILGLPGESHEDLLATAREIARLPIDAVKIHNLYVVRHTALAEQFERGAIRLLDRDAYASAVVDFLELLPPDCVVERLMGDAPRSFLIAPDWCLDKQGVLEAIDERLRQRDTWQGRRASP